MPLILSSHLLRQASLSSSFSLLQCLFLSLSLPFLSLSSPVPPYPSFSFSLKQMTEIAKQGGLLTVDCVVICCCCPCVVLQVTIFLFIRLPHKLAVQSKRIILKKLHKRLRLRKRKAGDNNDSVVVVKRDDNECFWMEFDDPIQRSEPPAIRKSGNVLFLGSEEGNDGMNAWIDEDMKFVFSERNACLGDEEVWREMLERGVFWFGSFWANGDYLE